MYSNNKINKKMLYLLTQRNELMLPKPSLKVFIIY